MTRREEIEQNKELLKLWLEAEKAVATGQSYSIGNRTLTRVDAKTIIERIEYYEKRIKALESGKQGGIRFKRAVIYDN